MENSNPNTNNDTINQANDSQGNTLDDQNNSPISDSPLGPNDSSESQDGSVPQNETASEQPGLPSHLLLEKKSSANSIFDAVEEDSGQSNQVSSENKTVIVLGKNETNANNLTVDKKLNSPLSIFDANMESENNSNDTVIVEVKNSTHNLTNFTNFDNKIKQFNESFAIKNSDQKNISLSSNLTEISKLAMRNNNKAVMIELKSNTNSSKKIEKTNRTKIKKETKININNTQVKEDKDKQLRIAKFYKAYQEKRKELQKKLKELNKPPLFRSNELNKYNKCFIQS